MTTVFDRKKVAKPEPIMLMTANGREIEKPTFKNFHTHEKLMEIAAGAGTIAPWDWNTALGDTIKEKYESFYCKLLEVRKTLIAKGVAGYMWIAASPEICSILEVSTHLFSPAPSGDWSCEWAGLGVTPVGINYVDYCGTVGGNWRLYKDALMSQNVVLMGVNDKIEPPQHYAVIKIMNFEI